MIEACSLSSETDYIVNSLQRVASENQSHNSDETQKHKSFLAYELKKMNPDYIGGLGASAAHALLERTFIRISMMRPK